MLFQRYWYVHPRYKSYPNIEKERAFSRNKTDVPKASISEKSMAKILETALANIKELQGRTISKPISPLWSISWSEVDAKLRIIYPA